MSTLYDFTDEERELYDTESSMYAILRAIELLERAWINDKVDNVDYDQACKRLIS